MPEMNSFDQQKIVYKTSGNPKHTPIVLIPGFAVDHTLWGMFLDKLATNYYIILIDHRGTGLNSALSFPNDMMVLAHDIAAIIKAEKLAAAHIVGHSMGGYIAQHFAHSYPAMVTSLILMSTYQKKFSNQTWSYKSLLELVNYGVDRRALIINSMPWLYSASYMDNEQQCIDHIERMNEREFPPSIETILAQINIINHFDASAFLAKLKMPTLVIGGDEDRIIPETYFQQLSQALPNAQLKIIQQTGHMIHIEKPNEVAKTIMDFIANE